MSNIVSSYNSYLTNHMSSYFERNQEATVYLGNLDSKVDENILWELFIQCAPVVSVHIPRDRISKEHNGFGFLEFRNEIDCDYAVKVMNMIKLYGKPIKVNKASQDKKHIDIGANIYVGDLSHEANEKMIKDVFSQFGNIINIKLKEENNFNNKIDIYKKLKTDDGLEDTVLKLKEDILLNKYDESDLYDKSCSYTTNKKLNKSKIKKHAIISYDSFESSDNAIKALNDTIVFGKKIKVDYAIRPDSNNLKYGSLAERVLANGLKNNTNNSNNNNITVSASTDQSSSIKQVNTANYSINNRIAYTPNLALYMQMNHLNNSNNLQININQNTYKQ